MTYFLAFYGYFFDLLAAGDTIPPAHPTAGFGFSTSCRDIPPSGSHATMDRPGFTRNAIPFYFGGFLPF